MALEGTLEDFSLADIFQLIGIQRKSGILTLKNSEETVTVTFHNGMVIGADTSPRKLEDRIGKVLVKTGLISQEELKEALNYQQKTMQKIGFILVDQKFISREELREALQIQVTQMIYRLFRWNSGEYYFDQKARVDPDADESISPMSAESILMEGIHMIDEWPVIQKKIPNFNVVFRPLLQLEDFILEDSDNGNGNGTGKEGSDRIHLSKDEEAVFRLVDGQNSVADIIESSKLGEFHTCKALYDLLERKIIESSLKMSRPVHEPVLFQQGAHSQQSNSTRVLYPLLILVVGLLLYWNLSDPLKLPGASFFQPDGASNFRATLTASRINLVDSALIMYFHITGSLPEKLDELVAKHYLSRDDIVDASSRPFAYEVNGNSYVLAGYTADGKPDDHLKFERDLASRPQASGKQKPGSGNGQRINLQN
jgi:hypothetical protein